MEFAFKDRDASSEYVELHAKKIEKEVVEAHINLYVNEFSLSLGEKGRKAAEKVFEKVGRDSSSVFVES